MLITNIVHSFPDFWNGPRLDRLHFRLIVIFLNEAGSEKISTLVFEINGKDEHAGQISH